MQVRNWVPSPFLDPEMPFSDPIPGFSFRWFLRFFPGPRAVHWKDALPPSCTVDLFLY